MGDVIHVRFRSPGSLDVPLVLTAIYLAAHVLAFVLLVMSMFRWI